MPFGVENIRYLDYNEIVSLGDLPPRKGLPFRACMMIRLLQLGGTVVKGAWRHLTGRSRLPERYFFVLPIPAHFIEIIWKWAWGPSEPDTPGLCCGDTLCLPLFDAGSFVSGDKGQKLQHNVAEECSHQILAPACIQQGHIQNHDIHLLRLGQNLPLAKDFLIIAPKTVDALDVEQIVFLQFADQTPVGRTVEILARLLVYVNVRIRYACLSHCDALAVLALVCAAHPDVSIYFHDLLLDPSGSDIAVSIVTRGSPPAREDSIADSAEAVFLQRWNPYITQIPRP